MPSSHVRRLYTPHSRTTMSPLRLLFPHEPHCHGTTSWSTPSSPISTSSLTRAQMCASRSGQNLLLRLWISISRWNEPGRRSQGSTLKFLGSPHIYVMRRHFFCSTRSLYERLTPHCLVNFVSTTSNSSDPMTFICTGWKSSPSFQASVAP